MDQHDRPDYKRPEYQAMVPDVITVRDVEQGTAHVKRQGEKYLPKAEKENFWHYGARLKTMEQYQNVLESYRAL